MFVNHGCLFDFTYLLLLNKQLEIEVIRIARERLKQINCYKNSFLMFVYLKKFS